MYNLINIKKWKHIFQRCINPPKTVSIFFFLLCLIVVTRKYVGRLSHQRPTRRWICWCWWLGRKCDLWVDVEIVGMKWSRVLLELRLHWKFPLSVSFVRLLSFVDISLNLAVALVASCCWNMMLLHASTPSYPPFLESLLNPAPPAVSTDTVGVHCVFVVPLNPWATHGHGFLLHWSNPSQAASWEFYPELDTSEVIGSTDTRPLQDPRTGWSRTQAGCWCRRRDWWGICKIPDNKVVFRFSFWWTWWSSEDLHVVWFGCEIKFSI